MFQLVVIRFTTSPGLREVGEEVAPGSRRIEPFERARRVRAGERDARRVLVGEVEQALAHPRRDVVERVLGGVRDALALQPLVEVEDVDVLRAPLVGGARDPAGDVLLADVARDRDELTRLDVRAEDGELARAVSFHVVDLAHGGNTLARMAACASTPTSRAPASRRDAAPDELIRAGRVRVNGAARRAEHRGGEDTTSSRSTVRASSGSRSPTCS